MEDKKADEAPGAEELSGASDEAFRNIIMGIAPKWATPMGAPVQKMAASKDEKNSAK